jgi:hypothetical protein
MNREDGGKDPKYSSILIFLGGAKGVSGEGGNSAGKNRNQISTQGMKIAK